MEISLLIIPAFIAGMLTFLAPCTLPMVPGYLAFISGTSLKEVSDPEGTGKARKRIFLNGLFYVIGFSAVFIVLGSVVGFAGSLIAPWRIWITRIGGAFVILFGLMMMGVLRIPFFMQERRVFNSSSGSNPGPLHSFLLGFSFAFGWTPCVGPVLGSILTLAAGRTTVFQGATLLSIFSLGLAVPFLAIAAGIGSSSRIVQKFSPYLNIVSFTGGLILIFLGILLATNNMALLVSYGYRLFDFINYDRLLDYL